ncbi:hypothetical protein Q7A53_05650 [Halobacillus rhizosphaerae]|uniref:hypothetical protein n=1 Tax=Halobacillus rhizosphaerae TaxID=3064889 RepID=UPI00398A5F2B
MPHKYDSTPINNKAHDKRVKLTETDVESIKNDYENGASIHSLSKKYNVSRRTIQFKLFPEREEHAKKLYAERRKDQRYYSKDKHRDYIKKHRQHKKELYENGTLKIEEDDDQ